mmetsp:Transcript_126713/g.354761  ORF Transcript_126713/g.354761 Transcript_126713/m.354761 type:complete len:209 (-) Transcript_126713:7-633(-)
MHLNLHWSKPYAPPSAKHAAHFSLTRLLLRKHDEYFPRSMPMKLQLVDPQSAFILVQLPSWWPPPASSMMRRSSSEHAPTFSSAMANLLLMPLGWTWRRKEVCTISGDASGATTSDRCMLMPAPAQHNKLVARSTLPTTKAICPMRRLPCAPCLGIAVSSSPVSWPPASCSRAARGRCSSSIAAPDALQQRARPKGQAALPLKLQRGA